MNLQYFKGKKDFVKSCSSGRNQRVWGNWGSGLKWQKKHEKGANSQGYKFNEKCHLREWQIYVFHYLQNSFRLNVRSAQNRVDFKGRISPKTCRRKYRTNGKSLSYAASRH